MPGSFARLNSTEERSKARADAQSRPMLFGSHNPIDTASITVYTH